MTFEQWWQMNVERLFWDHSDTNRSKLKHNMATCWNAALDAVEERITISDEKVSIQILPSIRATV